MKQQESSIMTINNVHEIIYDEQINETIHFIKHKDITNMCLINNSSSTSDKEKLRKDHQAN
jgi:hypothetical protein